MTTLINVPTNWAFAVFDDAIETISDRGIRIKQKNYLPRGSTPVIDQGESLIGGYTNRTDARIESPLPIIIFGDHTRRFKYVTFPFTVGADGVKLLGPTGLLEPKFLAYQLQNIDLEDRGYGRHYQLLRKLSFVVPPLPEQFRIVEKLEELLSDLDAGVAELKVAQKKLTQYRQSLLKAAVEGALTAEWRAERAKRGETLETGAQLLERILAERRRCWEEKQLAKFKEQGKTPPKDWRDKYPEPVKPNTANLPELPEGWAWTCIGQCFYVAVGATPSRKEPNYWHGEIPWVSSGEVCFSLIKKTRESITEFGLKNSSAQINPKGSILLGMIGEGKTRGQVAILDIEAANNQNCAAIWVSKTDISPKYVYWWLWSRYNETRQSSSGNNQPALNKFLVEKIPLPLPPLQEIWGIVETVETSLAQVEQLERTVDLALKQSSAQRQNILKAAFSGQLVPQDPNDEPASVLLERIRAERAARESGGRRRGRKAREDAA